MGFSFIDIFTPAFFIDRDFIFIISRAQKRRPARPDLFLRRGTYISRAINKISQGKAHRGERRRARHGSSRFTRDGYTCECVYTARVTRTMFKSSAEKRGPPLRSSGFFSRDTYFSSTLRDMTHYRRRSK